MERRDGGAIVRLEGLQHAMGAVHRQSELI